MRELVEPGRADLRLTAVLHALSDPTRLSIVRALAGGEKRACGEFETGLTKPSLTYHFRVLRESGITYTRRDGRNNFISLRRGDLDAQFPGLIGTVLNCVNTEISALGSPM